MNCAKCTRPAQYLCASCGEHAACSIEHMQDMWGAHSTICIGNDTKVYLKQAQKLTKLFSFKIYNVQVMGPLKKEQMNKLLFSLKDVCRGSINPKHIKTAWTKSDYLFTFEHEYEGQKIDSFLTMKKLAEHRYHIDLICGREIRTFNEKRLPIRLSAILHGLFLHWIYERDPKAQIELDAATVNLIPYYGAFNYRVGSSCENMTEHVVTGDAVRMILCDVTTSILFTDIEEYIKKADAILSENVRSQIDKISVWGSSPLF